jgi:hypothetical protein
VVAVIAVIAGVIGIVVVIVVIVVTIVIGVGAGASAKNGGGERQRPQSGLQPDRLLHGTGLIETVAFCFHYCVFLWLDKLEIMKFSHVAHRSHRRSRRREASEDLALLVGENLAGLADGTDEGHAGFPS